MPPPFPGISQKSVCEKLNFLEEQTTLVVDVVVVDVQRLSVQKLSVVDDLLAAGRQVDDFGVAVNPAHTESSVHPDLILVLPVPHGHLPVRHPVPELPFDPGDQLLEFKIHILLRKYNSPYDG